MERYRNLGQFAGKIRVQLRINRKRKPPKGSAPALVEPPRGPLPLQGGAEAPLEFD